jgi:hypothetical protein
VRLVHFLKAAAAFFVVIFAAVLAAPSAQAVGTYNRTLENVTYGSCIGVSDIYRFDVRFASCGSTVYNRWYVLVKSDSYRGTGHEVWQIKNAYHANECIVAGNENDGQLRLGSCAYSGNVHNKFEVFHSTLNGKSVDQLKDIEAWENNGQHRCIYQNSLDDMPLMGACNQSYESYWRPAGW